MTAASRAIARVSDLLEGQRTALMSGDLVALGQLAPDLEQALQRLAGIDAPADELDRLRRAAARNAQLIGAAQRGVAQAQRMIRPPSAQPLTTYDPNGRQTAVGPGQAQLLSRR